MENKEIKEYLLDFQKRELPKLIERTLVVDKTKKIKSIIGPRRAGKTYFLYQKMKQLIESNTKKENIIYLNFEDPRLINISFKEIRDIIKLHWQIFPSSTKGKTYIFIDEPQNIKNWEVSIRALYEEGFIIFLSGSSSKLLSKEISTSLRGRTLSYTLLPFSFQEFLKMRSINLEFSKLSSKEESVLLSLIDEYLDFGGFPEIISEKNKENKIRILDEYFNLIVYRDIVERYKIKNTQIIKWLIKSLTTSFSKEFSVHKVYTTLKSKGIKVSKNTLYSYLSMLEDSLFVFLVPKFSHSIRKKELSINKAYLCDVGFTKLLESTSNKGKKMENIVFLELIRTKKPLTEISYWKNTQQQEVDFILKEAGKIKQLIQVCYNLDDYDTKKRETRALLKAGKELKCKNLLIITENKEKDGKIKYIPLWKWLLKEADKHKKK